VLPLFSLPVGVTHHIISDEKADDFLTKLPKIKILEAFSPVILHFFVYQQKIDLARTAFVRVTTNYFTPNKAYLKL
jgi:hypothetical protein